MKKLTLLLIVTSILLSFSATSFAADSNINSLKSLESLWPFDKNACMYVHQVDYSEKSLGEDAIFSGERVTASAAESLWFQINNLKNDVIAVHIIITSTDGFILFEKNSGNKDDETDEQYSRPSIPIATGIFLQLPASRLYGECTAKMTVEREGQTSEFYTFYISVTDSLIPLNYTNYKFSATNTDLMLQIECSNLTQTVNVANYSDISVKSKNGMECFNSEIDKIWLKESDVTGDDSEIHYSAVVSKPLKADMLGIPFTRSGTETNYCLTIPEGTFLLENGWNKEFILDFQTDTSNAKQQDFVISVTPTESTIVYLTDDQTSIPMTIKISKNCIIDRDMKITESGTTIEYVLSDKADCYEINLDVPIAANNYYRIIFEDGKITLPNGRKNQRLSFQFETKLRSTIDLPDQSIFIDLPPEHWAYEFISALTKDYIISGYEDGTFKPENYVTRAELAKLLSATFEVSSNSETVFTDIQDHWAKEYITSLSNVIPIRKTDNTLFLANEPATREEVAASFARLLKDANMAKSKEKTTFLDEPSFTPELLADVEFAASLGLVAGYPDGTFRPWENITRAEIAAMLYRVLYEVK